MTNCASQEPIPLQVRVEDEEPRRKGRPGGSGSCLECASLQGSVYWDFITVLQLLSVAWEKDTQLPLDGAGTVSAYGLAVIIPNLSAFEIGMAPQESARIFRFILAVAALPCALQADVLAAKRSTALFARQ